MPTFLSYGPVKLFYVKSWSEVKQNFYFWLIKRYKQLPVRSVGGVYIYVKLCKAVACPGELTEVTHLMQMCGCIDCGTRSAAAARYCSLAVDYCFPSSAGKVVCRSTF